MGLAVVYHRVIFDLDGTITDPMRGIIQSVNHALTACGMHEIRSTAGFSWFVGPPLREGFKRLVGSTDQSLIERLVTAYRERYATVGLYETVMYHGIVGLLNDLYHDRRTLILGTSKPTTYAERVMEHLELDHLFDKVVGCELDGRRSGKDEIIRYVIEGYGGPKSDYIMIGDRDLDISGARSNGIDSVGVLWGYGSASEIAGSGPTFVAKNVDDVSAILLRLPRGARRSYGPTTSP